MATSILIINPNSSTTMTAHLQTLLSTHPLPSTTYTFFTGPSPSPSSIDTPTDAILSSSTCLPHLLLLLPLHGAFIIACYSEHPLVAQLRAATAKPVLGILEASITQALQLLPADSQFGIVTTGKGWEVWLRDGVARFLGAVEGGGRFAGVQSTGLSARELHEVGEVEVQGRIAEAAGRLLDGGEVGVVCLGCAGMAGMGEVVEGVARGRGRRVWVVDGVLAAVVQVVGLVECGFGGV